MRWGQDGDNVMDHGGDEVVSYSPCQSILRLMMLLWCHLCHWLWLWRMNHLLIYHSVTYYQVRLVWNNDNHRSLTEGPCQICPSSLACSWTFSLLQYKNSSHSVFEFPTNIHWCSGVNVWPKQMTHFSDADGSQYKNTKNFRSRGRKSEKMVATLRNHLFCPDRKRPVCRRYICTHYF